jgi:hypothetical protein
MVFRAIGEIEVEAYETQSFVYLVFKTSQFLVIAVRGTVPSSLPDWRINFNAFKTPGKGGGYHCGFYGEARDSMPELEKLVNKLRGWSVPLYFTGHSLGGAVASILAQIWPHSQPCMTPYVFGSPRFGSSRTVQVASPYTYVTPVDLVPHLPPRAMGFADAEGYTALVPADQPRLSGLATLLRWPTPGNGCTAPHAIEHYCRVLGTSIVEDLPEAVYIGALVEERCRRRY